MGAVREVGTLAHISPNDDLRVGVDFGFSVTIDGISYVSAELHNNGFLVVNNAAVGVAASSPYTPTGLPSSGPPTVFAFWADVDTRSGGDVVRYGPTTVSGRPAWVANWLGVGYYGTHYDKLNYFQLIVYNVPGGFEFELNYDQILWETGDASDGVAGFGGDSALMGAYLPGPNPTSYVKGWSGSTPVPGSLLDSSSTGLIRDSYMSGVLGRYIFTDAYSTLKVKGPDGIWRLVGTPAKPLSLKMPDGTWRLNPRFKQKRSDGTWEQVTR